MVKKMVIYDSLNRLVWVPGQRKAGSMRSVKFYGKDAKEFKSNVQARAYALRLAKSKKVRVYDKFYGGYLRPNKPKPWDKL